MLRRLKIDPTTRARLGQATLTELRANLWPVNCQTCGQPFGFGTPALALDDEGAALHHRKCPSPAGTRHLTWRTAAFQVPRIGVPIFLVNPSYEAARLAGGRIATLDPFTDAGMALDFSPERASTPLDGLVATLSPDRLDVSLTTTTWSGALSPEIAHAVDSFGAVLVGVTTALDVSARNASAHLWPLITRRQVALGTATVHYSPEAQTIRGTDVDPRARHQVVDAIRRELGVTDEENWLPAAVVCCEGDSRMLAELDEDAKILALLLVAGVYAGRKDGVHVFVPDEIAGRVKARFEPVLPQAEVGTRFTTAAGLAVVWGTTPDDLRPYRRVLTV